MRRAWERRNTLLILPGPDPVQGLLEPLSALQKDPCLFVPERPGVVRARLCNYLGLGAT